MPLFGRHGKTDNDITGKLAWQAYERVKGQYDEIVRRLTSREEFEVIGDDDKWYRVTYTLIGAGEAQEKEQDDNGDK